MTHVAIRAGMPRQTPRRTYSKKGLKATPASHNDGRRQSYLPGVLSTVRRRSAAAMTPNMRQQTLTQIDFVERSPLVAGEADLLYEDEEAPEEAPARPAKRQKRAVEQPTTADVRPRSVREQETGTRADLAVEHGEVAAAKSTRKRMNKFKSRSAVPPPKTPHRSIKKEVPSSQSPEERPLSAHSNWSTRSSNVSPLKDVSNLRSRVQTRTSRKVQPPNPNPKPAKSVSTKAESQASTKARTAKRARPEPFFLADKENQPPDPDEPLCDAREAVEEDPSFPTEDGLPFIPDSEDEGSIPCYRGLHARASVARPPATRDTGASHNFAMLKGTYSPHRESPRPEGEASLQEEDTMPPPPVLSSAIRPTTPRRSLAKASRSLRTSQPSPHSFVPVLETETQAQAAFQPFSPSMLVRSSQPSSEQPERASAPDTQATLPPPPKFQLSQAHPAQPAQRTQSAAPPIPTSQPETEVPPGFAPCRSTPSPDSPSARTPKPRPPPARDVVVIDSSSPLKEGGGRPSWDWSALPESQLLPDSIMQFMAKPPGASHESLHSEALEDEL